MIYETRNNIGLEKRPGNGEEWSDMNSPIGTGETAEGQNGEVANSQSADGAVNLSDPLNEAFTLSFVHQLWNAGLQLTKPTFPLDFNINLTSLRSENPVVQWELRQNYEYLNAKKYENILHLQDFVFTYVNSNVGISFRESLCKRSLIMFQLLFVL
jgi:hypothetical protein